MSTDVDPVLFVAYEIYRGGGPSTYIFLGGLLLFDSSPLCTEVLVVSLHTFALLLMILNAPRTISYIYYPKYFPSA